MEIIICVWGCISYRKQVVGKMPLSKMSSSHNWDHSNAQAWFIESDYQAWIHSRIS